MFPLLIVAAALLLALIYLAQQFARPRPLPYFPHLNSTHWLQGDFPLALQSFMATGQFALYFEKIYERLGSRTYQFFFPGDRSRPALFVGDAATIELSQLPLPNVSLLLPLTPRICAPRSWER